MRLRPRYLVLTVAGVVALGALLVLVARRVPAGPGGKTEDRNQSTQDSSIIPPPSSEIRLPEPSPASRSAGATPRYRYKVVRTYPHDRRFFTQGLVYEGGFLYEGTGLYGESAIMRRDLQTGKILQMLRLPEKYFGEGITIFGDKLIQLTWQSSVAFVYERDTLRPLGEFRYTGEGWGLTHDGTRLIFSDGTATLRFLDPNTYVETGRMEVRDQGRPVRNLNELEFVPGQVEGQGGAGAKDEAGGGRPETGGASGLQPAVSGLIYANIWPTDRIAIIDPTTGRVTGWIDLSGLYNPPAAERDDSVLNGIAYLPQTKRLLVTGKRWPRMYEIELVPEPPR